MGISPSFCTATIVLQVSVLPAASEATTCTVKFWPACSQVKLLGLTATWAIPQWSKAGTASKSSSLTVTVTRPEGLVRTKRPSLH